MAIGSFPTELIEALFAIAMPVALRAAIEQPTRKAVLDQLALWAQDVLGCREIVDRMSLAGKKIEPSSRDHTVGQPACQLLLANAHYGI